MGVRALILINDSGVVDVKRQMEACWTFIQGVPGLSLAGLLRPGSDGAAAAEAIRSGQADMIVAAYRDPKLELTGEIEAVGGSVEYVQVAEPGRLTVRGIIINLYRRLGWSSTTIARAVGGDTSDVRDHLRRSGVKHPR